MLKLVTSSPLLSLLLVMGCADPDPRSANPAFPPTDEAAPLDAGPPSVEVDGAPPEVDSAPPEPLERPWRPPNEPGPFPVGLTTLEYEDARGKTLKTDVWYPAELTESDRIAHYQYTMISGISYAEPALERAYGPHPLVAFSHGYISIRYQSYVMMEHLASHGFVVIATDHATNTILDLDPSNDPLMMLERPDDIRYAVDHVYALSQEPGLLEGALESDDYAALGHSFGSVTAMILGGGQLDWPALRGYCDDGIGNDRVCALVDEAWALDDGRHGGPDPRVVATVAMSPGIWYAFGEVGRGLSQVVNPFVLAGERDDVLDWPGEGQPAWRAMASPKVLALFSNAGHYGFTLLCDLIPGFKEECAGPDGGWEDLRWVLERSQVLVLAHLGLTMLDDPRYAPWLAAGEPTDDGRLTVESVP